MNRMTPELSLAQEGARPARRRRWLRLAILLFLAAVGAYFAGEWLHQRQTHVFVIDSRIASDMITLSSQASGQITHLDVQVGDRVRRGQQLAALDSRAIALRIGETDAELARLGADVARLQAERRLIQRQTASAIGAAQAHTEVAQAEVLAVQALRDQAKSDLDRGEALFQRKVIASQRLDELRSAFANVEQQHLRARAALREAEAERLKAEAEQDRLDVIDREIGVLAAESKILEARRDQLEVEMADRRIVSDIDGVVDQTFVEIGEYVQPGTRLVMIHDPADVWIAANIKETELSRFGVGATADIVVDAYSAQHFKGTVTWIGPAATSEFALLPNPNPSGNFTKVTQRVPVRIDLEGPKELLRPGMMVEVSIDVRDD